MKTLILGGTRFVGRHIAQSLLDGGHELTIMTRGKSKDDLPAAVERLRGDRDGGAEGLAALKGRTWDACVDTCGFTPRQVRPSAELLKDKVGRYLFISTGSVHGAVAGGPVDEKTPRLAPAAESVTEVTPETYGPLKVACEDIVGEIYGGRGVVLRPQIVSGPRDDTRRFTYWAWRSGRPGPVLAPGDGSDHVQTVDGRDLGAFARTCLEKGLSGAFNAAGHRVTWKEFLAALGVSDPVWMSAKDLEAGSVPLPLYCPDGRPYSGLMNVSAAKAQAAGLTLTPLLQTIADTRAWLKTQAFEPMLTPEREAELIGTAR